MRIKLFSMIFAVILVSVPAIWADSMNLAEWEKSENGVTISSDGQSATLRDVGEYETIISYQFDTAALGTLSFEYQFNTVSQEISNSSSSMDFLQVTVCNNSGCSGKQDLLGVDANGFYSPVDLGEPFGIIGNDGDWITYTIGMELPGILSFDLYNEDDCFSTTVSIRNVDLQPYPTVPEPASFAMLGSGLVGLFALARKRSSSKKNG